MAFKYKASLVPVVLGLAGLGLASVRPAAAQTAIYGFQVESSTANPALAYTGAGIDAGAANGSFVSALPTSDGTYSATSGNVTFSVFGGSSNYNTGTGADPLAAQALLSQFIYSKNVNPDFADPGHFTVSGLVANSAYTLYLYGGDSVPSQQTSYTVVGSVEGTQSLSNAQNTTFVQNVNYDVFTGLASANGTIIGTFTSSTPGANYYGLLNGAQITGSAAPEPTSLAGIAFTGLGVLGLILKARQRKSSLIAA